jgi:hypothetical protein
MCEHHQHISKPVHHPPMWVIKPVKKALFQSRRVCQSMHDVQLLSVESKHMFVRPSLGINDKSSSKTLLLQGSPIQRYKWFSKLE